MVSNASDDLPDPDRPVITVSESRGMTTSTFFRLCSRAPRTWMEPAIQGPACSQNVLGLYGKVRGAWEAALTSRTPREVYDGPSRWQGLAWRSGNKGSCDGWKRQQGDPGRQPGQGPGGAHHAGWHQDRQLHARHQRDL